MSVLSLKGKMSSVSRRLSYVLVIVDDVRHHFLVCAVSDLGCNH